MNKMEVLRAAYREGAEAANEVREKTKPSDEARGIFIESGRRRRRFVQEVRDQERRKSDSA